MTNEEIIMDLMQTAPIYSETRTWYAEFTYFTIDTQVWENDTYKLIRTNHWDETYNLDNVMGGYSNVGSSDELTIK